MSGREPAVVGNGIVKRYGDLTAVNGVDIQIQRGTCLGVLGPNGAGKTTLIEILEGIKSLDEGDVTILGRTWNGDARAIQERIGVQLQETDFQDKLTVRELLRLFRSFYESGLEVDAILDTIGLREKQNAHVKTLSGGQKQRVSIGCALLNDPEILFLDEPTTGLDPQARRRVWEIIEEFKSKGGTALLTTHYMEEAERLSDELLIIDHGRIIAQGSPSAIIASLEAESVIQFSLGESPRGLIEDDLTSLDGVRSVRYEGADVVLSVVGPQAVIARLFQLVESRNLSLEDLRTHRPTLEDVFVSLTGKHLRDE